MHLIACRNPLKRKGIGKTLLIMKLTAILLAICLNAAAIGNAQSVSISEQNAPLEKIFREIKRQTGYTFVYRDALLKKTKKVTVNLSNASIEQVLNFCLQGQPLSYSIVNKIVVLKEKELALIKEQIPIPPPPVSIQGKILNDKNEPLAGATVTEKGTNNSTVTKGDGSFALNVTNAKSVLTISFVGYEPKEVIVKNETALTVQLVLQNKALNDIVVIGYGTQRKVNLTGAVSNVPMDDLQNRPLTNSSAALQGKVAGVFALQKSGKPGGDDAVINIRGIGTLNNSNPLVLIDGFPGDINDVSVNDIESISILKDASSAAIYGNRAANGVILITTKRGSNRKVKVAYNGYYGVQQVTALPKMVNSAQWARLYNEASVNGGTVAKYTEDEIQKYASGTDWRYPSVNYFDAYYDKAKIQSHRLNMTGGSDNLQYAFMLGYLDQDGVLTGTNYKKLDFRSNFDAFFLKNNKLRLSARLSGNSGVRNEPTDEYFTKGASSTAPIWPQKNDKGQWIAVIGEHNYYGELMEGSTRNAKRYYFNGQLEAEYKIINDLSAQVTYGSSIVSANTNAFHSNILLANMDGSTRYLASDLSETNDQNTQTLLTTLLRYKKRIYKHDFNLLAGYSEEEFDWKWNSGFRSGYVNNDQRYLNLGDPSTQQNNSGAYDLGLRSVFGRFNYAFDDKYLFEANVRRDGSSRFAEGYKWGTFPSFSAGWILSRETFLQNLGWLNFMKIRGSWGQLGNQNINTYYAASDILTTGLNYPFGGSLFSGVASNILPNKQTTWETTEQTNIGLDVTLLRNFELTFDYFIKNTRDILVQIPIPLTMGNLTPPYQNVGKVKNRGFELSATYRKQLSNGLNIKSTVNLSQIKNEVLDLYGRSPIINGPTALIEGHPINAWYGYKTDGIYQIDDFTWQNNSDPTISPAQRDYILKNKVVDVSNFKPTPGDIKYRDLDGDGVVTLNGDRTVIGKQFPNLTYSWQMNLDWKQFDLGMFWQGVSGIDGYYNWPMYVANNVPEWWLDRWTPDNPSNTIPKVSLDGARNAIVSKFSLQDASYLRLKNIEVGYSLNKKTGSNIGISSLRIYGNIQNAFTITKFKGFDPERAINESSLSAYPQTRIYTVGLNVNF
jgi:TonB-linked SusC/RagA family outer membrane protein